MTLTPENIKTQLQTLTKGEKAIFKNDAGKVKVFFLKNDYYFVTFNGCEIESVRDLNAVFETVKDLLKLEIV